MAIPESPHTRLEMYLDAIAKGGGDITVESKTVTANGTVTAPSGKAYSPIIVNVPNSYTAGDNGKVVNNGQLVSQTAHAEVTQNGTIDTTLNNSVVVNVSGGGGSSPWTKLAEQDFTVSTSSTSATVVGTISCGSAAWTSAKMLYIRVRDKAGKRNGYFYGSDNFIINTSAANGTSADYYVCVRVSLRTNSNGSVSINQTTGFQGYGVYHGVLKTDGTVEIYSKYSATETLSIDGTYHVEVYTLEWPDNVSPFA